MPIIGAFMVPHPLYAIPEIGKGKENELSATTSSFNLVAKKVAQLHPDTIIWISPHAESYADFFQVADGEVATGSFKKYGAPEISFRMLYDKILAKEISQECKICNFRGGMENGSEDSLDHGTMVPLYFINREFRDFLSVRVGVSGLSLAEHYRFGQIIRSSIDKLGRKAVIIASGDLAHCQSKESAYGYRPEGAIYDDLIMKIMSKMNFGELLSFDRTLMGEAIQCGHRAFTVLAGCLDRYDLDCLRLSHEAPYGTGYGFCCYTPKTDNQSRAFLNLYLEREKIIAKEKKEHADNYVSLAREAIEYYSKNKKLLKATPLMNNKIGNRKEGVFVTIYYEGELRGCIGTIKPKKKTLAEEIIANAVGAAFNDARFEPSTEDDLDKIIITVDVVVDLIPVLSIDDLNADIYGVMVEADDKHAVVLPKLPGVLTPERQIEICKRKAGIPQNEDVDLYRFNVEHHK